MKTIKLIITIIFVGAFLQSFAPINSLNIEHKEINNALSHFDKVLKAIIIIESGGRADEVNKREDAVGILQLRRIYVDESNRLANKNYNYEDRFNVDKSIEMFKIVTEHYCTTYSLDSVCAIHNAGGVKRIDFELTLKYRKKVEEIFNNM